MKMKKQDNINKTLLQTTLGSKGIQTAFSPGIQLE